MYLESVFGEAGKARGVVLGFDHRAYNSLNSEVWNRTCGDAHVCALVDVTFLITLTQRFAVLSAAVLMSKGFTVYLYNRLVSTPSVVRTAPSSCSCVKMRTIFLLSTVLIGWNECSLCCRSSPSDVLGLFLHMT